MSEATNDNERNTTTDSKFWGNMLIWDKLTSYLRLSDLMALSLINKFLLQKVRTNKRLIFKQIVIKDFELCAPRVDKAIVVVDSIDENCLNDLGLEIFENVTYLALGHFEETELMEARNKDRVHKILGYCKHLKSLDLRSLSSQNWENFLNDSAVKNILSQLEELYIVTLFCYNENRPGPSIKVNAVENSKKIYQFNLQLKRLCYFGPNSFFNPDFILAKSLNSLAEIQLYNCELNCIRNLYFPNLAKFLLWNEANDFKDFDQEFLEVLIPFSKRHLETLKNFAVHGRDSFNLEPFCDVFKSSKKIKLLSFSTSNSFTRSILSINWNFLQKLSSLRSFELKKNLFDGEDDEVPPKFDFMKQLLSALPSTLTTIRLSGVFKLIFQDFLVTVELDRFKSLTELSITEGAFFEDDALQFICSRLTTLRILHFECVTITDFGISGLKDDGSDSGISLKNLKGLNTLVMNSRYNLKITWKGLLNAIEFRDLVTFEVKIEHKEIPEIAGIPGENYLKLIKQNPSLERCYLSFYKPDDSVRQEALRIHSRLNFKED